MRGYSKAHREAHPERQREYARASRARHPDSDRKWRAANPDKGRAIRKRYRERHPDADRIYRQANPDKQREYGRRYAAKNRAKLSDKNARYIARKKTNGPVERVDRLVVYARDSGRCHLCGRFVARTKFTLDHLVPIALGGHHTYANVKVAHLSCNSRKGARFISTP